jgi:uroporphyrinogen-III synthase
MTLTNPTDVRPLGGRRILIPRGGPWGNALASDLRTLGATSVIAPMTNFVVTDDAATLATALTDLAAGKFDWVTFTSATTVDVVSAYRAVIPESTKVAAVGDTTAAALKAAGYRADLVPSEDNSAHGLLVEWNTATGGVVPLRVLTLRSEDATPVLTKGLIRIGHDVHSVVAYRTIGVDVDPAVIIYARSGAFDLIVVTSGSVAQQIAEQIGEMPSKTLIAAVGPRTAKDARALGLRVDTVLSIENDELLRDLAAAALTCV